MTVIWSVTYNQDSNHECMNFWETCLKQTVIPLPNKKLTQKQKQKQNTKLGKRYVIYESYGISKRFIMLFKYNMCKHEVRM